MHVMAQAYSQYPLIVNEEGAQELKMYEWRLIAGYMNTPDKIKQSRLFMCTAQSEKILHDTKSYWRRQVEGFKKMVPYFVHLKDREIFCIPGLLNAARHSDGQQTGTFTLITKGANRLMEKIHNHGPRSGRMPMFMKAQAMKLKWLDPELTDKGIDEVLDYEVPSTHLKEWPDFTIRGPKPQPDGKQKTASYEWKDLAAL